MANQVTAESSISRLTLPERATGRSDQVRRALEEHAWCLEHLGVQHRTTRPCTPKTDRMVERFNGRGQREVLGIAFRSHAGLEILPRGFDRAYDAIRRRVLKGVSPDEAVRRRMEAGPKLASKRYQPPSDPCVLPQAVLVVAAAAEVSHPDS